MKNFLAKAALAILVTFGAIGAAAPASAASVDVDIRLHNRHHRLHNPHVVIRPGVVVRPRVVYQPRVIVRQPVVVIDQGYRGRCAPGLAVEKATWKGMRRAHVTHVGPYRLTVEGKVGHRWAKMVFANARGCPRI